MDQPRILTITGKPDPPPEPVEPRQRLKGPWLWAAWVALNGAGAGSYLFIAGLFWGQFYRRPHAPPPDHFPSAGEVYLLALVLYLSIPFGIFLQGVFLRGQGFSARFWAVITQLALVLGGVVVAVMYQLIRPIQLALGFGIRPTFSSPVALLFDLFVLGIVVGCLQALWLSQKPRELLKWSLASGVGFALGGLCLIQFGEAALNSSRNGNFSLVATLFCAAYASVTGFALRYLKQPVG